MRSWRASACTRKYENSIKRICFSSRTGIVRFVLLSRAIRQDDETKVFRCRVTESRNASLRFASRLWTRISKQRVSIMSGCNLSGCAQSLVKRFEGSVAPATLKKQRAENRRASRKRIEVRREAREARESETDRCAEPIEGNPTAKRADLCIFGEIHAIASIPQTCALNAKRSGLM